MSVTEELEKLQQLRDSGAIDDAEYAAAKAKVLNESPSGYSAPPVMAGEELERATRQWAAILHLSAFAGYFLVPVAGLVAPILIWQIKKDQLPGLDIHGRNATNWIISSLIYGVISGILILVVIGIPMLIALMACGIAFPIIAAVKANNGEVWKYPLTIEFV
ncbi:MAG: hypothetical protein JWP89_869 [Schlesneria sp.]|nr:hypothetical protein [Schlesneria sp.]